MLHIVRLPKVSKGVPLFAEIPVDAVSAPYLVTTNKKGLLWVERCFDSGVVRSALLKSVWAEVGSSTYLGVVQSVRSRGLERSWGNVFPYDNSGVESARGYLKSYDLTETELLTNDGHPWVPVGSAVLVPKDRSYLGIVGIWEGEEHHTVVVHNPSRGMAVLGVW